MLTIQTDNFKKNDKFILENYSYSFYTPRSIYLCVSVRIVVYNTLCIFICHVGETIVLTCGYQTEIFLQSL